jgi:type III secretion system HrpE/YscL family protein
MSFRYVEGVTVLPGVGALPSASRWIKAHDLRAWQSAEELLAGAQQQADERLSSAQREADDLLRKAKQAAEKQKKRGYEQGYEEGEGAFAEKILAFEASCAQRLSQEKAGLAELVFEALTRLVGELPDELWYEKCLQKIDVVIAQSKSLTLVVHPDDEAAVRAAVEQCRPQFAWLDWLQLECDERLPARSCLVSTEHGAVDAGLQFQLGSVLKALEAYFGLNAGELDTWLDQYVNKESS